MANAGWSLPANPTIHSTTYHFYFPTAVIFFSSGAYSFPSKSGRAAWTVTRQSACFQRTARWSMLEPGSLLFMKGGTLFAQPFDARNAVVVGGAQSLVTGVARLVSSSLAGFSVSRNGVLAL